MDNTFMFYILEMEARRDKLKKIARLLSMTEDPNDEVTRRQVCQEVGLVFYTLAAEEQDFLEDCLTSLLDGYEEI